MPPTLALALCAGFVFFLLRLDRQRCPGVAGALWLPSLWMVAAASKPLIYWFRPVGSSMEGGNPVDPLFHGALLLAGLLMLPKRRVDWSAFRRNNRFLFALLVFMLVSALWADSILGAVKHWLRELEAIVMAALVLTDPSPRQAIESVIRRTAYVLIPASMLVIKYFPLHGCQYGRWTGAIMWVGVTMQKNALGRLCLIAVAYLLWSLFHQRHEKQVGVTRMTTCMDIFVLLLSVWLLKGPTVQAYSATAVTSFCIGLASYLGLCFVQKRRLYFLRNAVLALVAVGIVGGTALPFVKGKVSDPQTVSQEGATGALGRDASFTGRTDIWASLMPDVARNPILGVGLLSFWTPENIASHDIGEAHNGYLEMLLHLGAVGLVMVSLFLLSTCRKALHALDTDFDWACFVACFVVVVTIHNMSESSVHCFTSTLNGVMAFLAITFPAALSVRKEPNDQHPSAPSSADAPEPQSDDLPALAHS